MALSFALVLRAGQLAGTSLISRTPGIAMFAAGLLAGTLMVALARWLRRHGSVRRHGWRKPAADDEPGKPPEMPSADSAIPVPGLQVRPARPAGPQEGGDAGPPSLRIGVLGPLTVNDQAGALVPAQSQLIVALALNRGGLGNDELRRLLGADADHPKPADSLRQLIARTRRALGQAPGKREWIEHLGHGHYALHPDVWLDWRVFGTLAAAGIQLNEAPPLEDALGLVRGQPFTGCYYWWLGPEHVESVTARVVAAAEALATLRLADSDPAGAGRAARIGLAADSSAEQLWRVVMRAEHAAGNLAGVRGAWDRCLNVAAEVAADGQPDAATAAVYSELLAR
jgi:DNA-binding SARP family transcriptional activator